MSMYSSIFKSFPHVEAIKEKMYHDILAKINERYDWFEGECKEHRLQHLEYTLRVLLFKNATWLSNDICTEESRKRKANKKLEKLNVKIKK